MSDFEITPGQAAGIERAAQWHEKKALERLVASNGFAQFSHEWHRQRAQSEKHISFARQLRALLPPISSAAGNTSGGGGGAGGIK